MHAKLSELLNTGKPFSHEGTEYAVKEATLRQRAEFSTWLENRAWEALERRRLNGAAEADVSRAMSHLTGEIAAGKYEWGGAYAIEACQTITGASHLLYLVLRGEHPEVTPETAQAMVEARYRQVAEFIAEHIADPKLLAELTGASATGGTA